MEKPLGFSDAVASGSIKRISSFFLFIWDLRLSHCYGLNREYYSYRLYSRFKGPCKRKNSDGI